MSLLTSDPLTQLAFSVYENRGVYALLLGSGISRAADIPTGWEITLDLVRRIAVAQGEENHPDWAAWYQEKFGVEPDYSALIGELGLSAGERRSILHSYIEPTAEDREEGRKVPTAAHDAIASLVLSGYIKVIITTNFDRLLENALRERGVEPTIVASVDALKGAEPIAHTTCYILKLHGDYKDARILNTNEELDIYPAEYDALLDRVFDEYGMIVCGWSGEWDHALRAAVLRSPARRYSHYWMVREDPGDGAKGLIGHRQAITITASDADRFFTDLEQRVETLAKTHRQNPVGLELLVSTVKRYLAHPEHRIQLDELLTEEVDRLYKFIDDPIFAPSGPVTPELYSDRVARYEASAEALARVAGVLGRWGDGSECNAVFDIIRALWEKTMPSRGGTVIWLNIHSYPVILVMTAYGLGLARSQRWHDLYKLFDLQIYPPNRGETQRVVELMFLLNWRGGDNDYWKLMEGLKERRTPLSDHLCGIFHGWGNSFLGIIPDYEILYEKYEILGSLVYSSCYTSELLTEALSQQNNQSYRWVPVGRSGWHSNVRERILTEIQMPEFQAELIEAGFAKGDKDFLKLSIENYNRLAERFRW
jgi:hypothetical protein